jgi:hypothetical protein
MLWSLIKQYTTFLSELEVLKEGKVRFKTRSFSWLLMLAIAIGMLFLFSCAEDNDKGEDVGRSDYAPGLFGYQVDGSRYFTQHIYDKMGAEMASGSWPSSHLWSQIVPITIKGQQFIIGHGKDRDEPWKHLFFIQKIFDTGDLGKETYRDDTWDHFYNKIVAFNVEDSHYIMGTSSEDNNRWFIQRVYSDGTLADQETHSGHWHYSYDTLTVMYAGGNTYIYGQSKSHNFYFTARIYSDGTLSSDIVNGHWGDYWPTNLSFEIGGKTYIFGHRRKSTWSNDGPWFIQRVHNDGKLGHETHGEWDQYYKTMMSFKSSDGNTYLFGQNEKEKNWFIQQVYSNGTLADQESDNGSWHHYYDIAFPFTLSRSYWHDDDWMDYLSSTIGDRKLIEIALPGSHDAGMNEHDKHDCWLGSSCNTITQTGDIGAQLKRGSRYFDLRPVLNLNSDGTGNWSTGHVTKKGEELLGCYGEDMASIASSLRNFFEESGHEKELVILKVSHCMQYTNHEGFGSGCSDEQINNCANGLVDELDGYLVKCDDCNLLDMTLDELLELGNIILVFADADRDRSKGIFRWGYGSKDDYYAYDSYSHTNHYSEMKKNQLGKLLDPDNHSEEDEEDEDIPIPFLLSWTLTLSDLDIINCPVSGNSILNLAATANPHLYGKMHELVDSKEITKKLFPNILYVDAFSQFATRTAVFLNKSYDDLKD